MLKMTRLRQDMDFNTLMSSVLEALKGVASGEYFRLQSKRKGFTDFDDHLKDFFEGLKLGGFEHQFLNPPQGSKNIILVTSDVSFLGKLNISVVNSGLVEYKEGDLLTVVGRQGIRYVEDFGKEFTFFSGIDDDISYESVVNLREYCLKTFLKENLAETIIIYPHFVSFAVQTIEQLSLLPCRFLFPDQADSKGAEAEGAKFWQADEEEKTIIEPSPKEIIEYFVKIWITRSIHQVFWESKLSEWAARIIHLDKSVDEIKRQDRNLRFQYFRLLHQISDQNIRETFCNQLVLSKGGRVEERGICKE